MAFIRLDKYLADMQIGTRSQVKSLIKAKRVKVNGAVAKKADMKIAIGEDVVFVDQKPIVYESYEYYILNKPQGVVSATVDNYHKTVVDLIVDRKRKDLFPVGRLDIDTEGLLLITNDGELCHNLLAPGKHIDKCYFAVVLGEVKDEAKEVFAKGVDIGTQEKPEWTRPARLCIQHTKKIAETDSTLREKMMTAFAKWYPEEEQKQLLDDDIVTFVTLTIQEGKFHQVKRMFQAIGNPVLYLQRIAMGQLTLPQDLALGEYRKISLQELECLL